MEILLEFRSAEVVPMPARGSEEHTLQRRCWEQLGLGEAVMWKEQMVPQSSSPPQMGLELLPRAQFTAKRAKTSEIRAP